MSDDVEPVRPGSAHALTHPDERPEDCCALGALATPGSESVAPSTSRRRVLQRAGAVTLALAAAPLLRPARAAASTAGGSDVLVFLFLRGALDGLNAVIPRGDRDANGVPYYDSARPRVGIVHADNHRPIGNGFFHHHPALDPLFGTGNAWDPTTGTRELAIVHAVGCDTLSRSHFDAQDLVDKGIGTKDHGRRDGWVGRLLATRAAGPPLRALAFSETTPLSLTHPALQPVVLRTLGDVRLTTSGEGVRTALSRLYGGLAHRLPIADAATGAFGAADAVAGAGAAGAGYPTTGIGPALSSLAQLIKAGPSVGVEAAAVNYGSFDHHSAMGGERAPANALEKWSTSGALHTQLSEVAKALQAFRADLRGNGLPGNHWERVTVVAVSEFGRRVVDNEAGGTEHGTAGVMLVLGGGVRADNGVYGNVYGEWPGLHPDRLAGGDLRVTTDYRRVLYEVATRRLGLAADHVGTVFPGAPPDLTRSLDFCLSR